MTTNPSPKQSVETMTTITDPTPEDEGKYGTAADGHPLNDVTEATNYYAGPFCGCGDYSCAANRDENAECSNRQD
ncbi:MULTISPECIES: hypothetical protein [Microbacteriaceae]|uniref:Uncharacterized protein n=1 Tax=Pseudoclavibacter helvolus TaxID=255205 RepID=A0A7W4ULD2_9MICO|nr:hypothetical protein [Pseudoclavibacter helvolus]MBB2956604.1 hypothetical protein [Pseudoclavibacter helvolus]